MLYSRSLLIIHCFFFAFLKLVEGTRSDLQLEEVTVVTLEADCVLIQCDKDSC